LFWNFSETQELAFFGSKADSMQGVDFVGLSRKTINGTVVHSLRYKQLPDLQLSDTLTSFDELLRSTVGAAEYRFQWALDSGA